ncbi:MAG: alpha/beta fold hydrolase [Flavobacteriales bacterium]|nr:alpha/beta fold hydrolase [Flavobacteriales bacterium]MCB9198255.1 alpha/beta fold hydrolase [Flavobacteriales bacterium]
MKLNYKREGSGDPLLIVHGLFGNLDNWQTLGKKFAEDFDTILIDQRNHGHSPHSDDFDYDYMAGDLIELIEDLGLKKVDIIGHSMGGKAAMRLAQLRPDLIDKLIVVDIGPKGYPMHHDTILEGLHAIDFKIVHSRSKAHEILSQYITDEGVKQFLLKNLYWKDKGILDWRINLPVIENNMDKIIGQLPDVEVEIPTLFIRGEKSNYIVENDYTDIFMQFPNSDIETVYNAGHWIHAENPFDFYNLVIEFLRN